MTMLDQPAMTGGLCAANPDRREMKLDRLDLNLRMIWKNGVISCLVQTQTVLMKRVAHTQVNLKATLARVIRVVVVAVVVAAVLLIVPA